MGVMYNTVPASRWPDPKALGWTVFGVYLLLSTCTCFGGWVVIGMYDGIPDWGRWLGAALLFPCGRMLFWSGWDSGEMAVVSLILGWMGNAVFWGALSGLVWWPLHTRLTRRFERMRHNQCPACGYDLRGSARSDACPECGALNERKGDVAS